jgi:hypothetical protein
MQGIAVKSISPRIRLCNEDMDKPVAVMYHGVHAKEAPLRGGHDIISDHDGFFPQRYGSV